MAARVIRLDTHAVIWLFTGEVERFSPEGLAAIDTEDLVVSPMVELELTFLHDIGRLTVAGSPIMADLRERIGLRSSDQSLASAVAAATPLSWTRDPFDRLIVGDALAANDVLLTRDRSILDHCALATW